MTKSSDDVSSKGSSDYNVDIKQQIEKSVVDIEQDIEGSDKQEETSLDSENAVVDESPKSNKTSAPSEKHVETAVVNQKTPISKLAIFCLILVLLLAGSAGYGVDKYMKEQVAQQEKIDALVAKQSSVIEDITNQLNQQVKELQTRNQSLTQELTDNVETQLASQQQSQTLINQKIAELSGRRPSDWLLAEANYLVTIAGRKLWQEKDQKTAAALLATADKRIAEMHDESLIDIRRALAKDIATLSGLPQDKSQDIALAIDGLITQVDNLKLNTVTLPDVVEDEMQHSTTDTSWQENLKQTWYGFVDGMITIRKRESNVVPLISAKQRWYLEENLKNKLVQAQLAVYRKQQQAFTSSIEVSRTWVLQFFDREDSATTFVLDELNKLEKVSITVNYPRDLLSRNLIGDEVVRRNISSAQGMER